MKLRLSRVMQFLIDASDLLSGADRLQLRFAFPTSFM